MSGALVRWIVRNNRTAFSVRDIERNFDRFKDDEAALADALDWMTRQNLIRPQAAPEASTQSGPKRSGRKAAPPSSEVNPRLQTAPRFRHFRRNPGH